ncbi:unnamed protein product [Caenorhabditis bovis]|uniref:Large ribosomal subunit protein eL38 n=1 Tax=Caenorhabditis bovis TaxID=2654633 RepID=A0A8S1E9L6_9PELO|nr:unnamed protein product [Caenorhabditis bovis]
MFEAYTPSEVAPKLPVEVACLTYQQSSSSVLAGGKTGHLFVFTSSTNRRGFEYTNMCKNFERSSVLELSVCEREEILLCVSGGQLVAHRLNDTKYAVETLLHKVKPVTTFAKYEPKGSGTLYLLVSSKKKLFLFKWGQNEGHDDFVEVSFDYNPVFTDTPTCIKCVDERIYFASRSDYYCMMMKKDSSSEKETWSGFIHPLLNFQSIPGIIPMQDRGRIAFVRNEKVVTTNLEGSKAPEEFKFSESPLQLVYDAPYLVAMLSKGRVEVRSSFDGSTIQTLSFNRAFTLCNGHRGQVFIAATNDIWLLDTSVNLRKNVSKLIQERQFELAIQLTEGSNLFSEENKVEIKRQAALNLFQQKKFDESFALFGEIKTEVLTILQMFPDLLPEGMKRSPHALDLATNDKMRAMLALGNFLSQIRTEYAKQIDFHNKSRSRSGHDDINKLLLTLRVVDTTLLRCYIKTKPTLVDSLIRLHNNACTFDDAESILKEENRIRSLFILYESRKKHEMALDLLIEQSSKGDCDPFFNDAIEKIVEYLQSLGNAHIHLIFRYAKWVLCKDLNAGVQIFIGDETEMTRNLDRRAVVNFMMNECVPALIPYLEHVIYKWEETDAFFHETLLEYYVFKVNALFKEYVHAFPDDENMTRAGEEEGDLGIYRQRLLKFLQYSQAYSPQTVLLKLSPHAFYEERALIYGRLKQHDKALAIYISTLKNNEAAEKYCELYYNPYDEVNSQVFLQLFRALVSSSNPPTEQIISPFGSYRDDLSEISTATTAASTISAQNIADVNEAIKILAKHADKIPTISALSLLPSQTPLRIVSSALNAVVQTTNDVSNMCSLQKCVSQCALEKRQAKKLAAESIKIAINHSTECVVCGKKLGVITITMPKEIKEIKEFLVKARRKDAKSVKIKKNSNNTKFKVRCSKYLYTLVVGDKDKAEKLKQSLPPGIQVKELK